MIGRIKKEFLGFVRDERFSEILAGSIWVLGAKAVIAVLAMLTSIIVAKYYGAEIVGIIAILNSVLMLLTMLTVMGTDTAILRLISEHTVRYSLLSAFRVYRKTILITVSASLLLGLAFFLYSAEVASKLFSKPHLAYYFALSSIFILFRSLMLLNTKAIRGLKLIRTFAFIQVLPHLFGFGFLLLFGVFGAMEDAPIYALFGGWAVTGLLGWGVVEFVFHKRTKRDDAVHEMPTDTILSISFPMLMTAAMTFLIGQTGVIMLGLYRSEAEVGYYAIAVKLANLTSVILYAVNSMAGPKFSELFSLGRTEELFYIAKKSTKLIFWTSFPILLVLIIFGKVVLFTLFGSEFIAAYSALLILVIAQFVHSISGATGLFMNMTGNQKLFRNIVFTAALANIVLNLLLTPRYGINGTAIVGMACIVGWNVAALYFMKVKYGSTTGYIPYV